MKILSNTLLATAVLLTLGAVAPQSAQAAPSPGSDPDLVVICEYSAHGRLFDQQYRLYTGCPEARIHLMPTFLYGSTSAMATKTTTTMSVTRQMTSSEPTTLSFEAHSTHDFRCLDAVFSRTVSDFEG
jgi:hypothetical protein